MDPLLSTTSRPHELGDEARRGYVPPERRARRGYVPPERRATWIGVCLILFAELVGTGALGLPYTFAKVGYGVGVALLLVFMALSVYSGVLLWRLGMSHPGSITYGDLAGKVMGENLWRGVIFFFVYTAFIGNMAINVLVSLDSTAGAFGWGAKDSVNLAVVAAIILPLSQLRTLHSVSYAGLLSAAAVIATFGLILYRCADVRAHQDTPPRTEIVSTSSSFVEAFSASTAAVFAFGGQGLYLETCAEMKDARDFRFSLLVTSAVILCCYMVTTLTIYFTFGEDVKPNAMDMLSPGALSTRVASGAMFLHVLVSYLLANQVICRAAHTRLAPQSVNKGGKREALEWLGITSFALALSFIWAVAVPDLSSLMGIIGSLTTAPLSFGFPAWFYLRWAKGSMISIWERGALGIMIVTSVFLLVAGTAVNIVKLFF